jgi:hypothetical protein
VQFDFYPHRVGCAQLHPSLLIDLQELKQEVDRDDFLRGLRYFEWRLIYSSVAPKETMKMRDAALACVLITMVQGISLPAADPDTSSIAVPLRFVVCASEADTEIGSSLFRALYSNGKRERFGKAQTIEQAVESDADVLILVLPTRDLPKLETSTLESLKKRKIVGIGYGAAQLFGQLGLEINGGACAHGVPAPPSLTIVKSELLGEPGHTESLRVLQDNVVTEPNAAKMDIFAVFLPVGGSKASVVDPIVRQGNCILIGIPAPATQWTPAYVDLIRKACLALQKRKLEAFSSARWEVTKPGTYEFNLAPRDDTDQPFEKSFYFQFKDAKSFHVS